MDGLKPKKNEKTFNIFRAGKEKKKLVWSTLNEKEKSS